MKTTAAIELNFAKKFIKEAVTHRKQLPPDHPINRIFRKYGSGPKKDRIFLKANGTPVASNAVIPPPIKEFLSLASESWTKRTGRNVVLVFENYGLGTIVDTVSPSIPLDKRKTVYFTDLLGYNKKVIGDEHYDTLRQIYDTDPQRKSIENAVQNYVVVISRHPYDILGYSTARNWESCMSVGSKNCAIHMPDEMKHSLVAYLVYAEDYVASKKRKISGTNPVWTPHGVKEAKSIDVLARPLARAAIKPYFDTSGNMLLAVGRVYGKAPAIFVQRLQKFVYLNNRKLPTGRYNQPEGLYSGDTETPASLFFSTTLENLNKDQAARLVRSGLASANMLQALWDQYKDTTFTVVKELLKAPSLPKKIAIDVYESDRPLHLLWLASNDGIGPKFAEFIVRKPKVMKLATQFIEDYKWTSIPAAYWRIQDPNSLPFDQLLWWLDKVSLHAATQYLRKLPFVDIILIVAVDGASLPLIKKVYPDIEKVVDNIKLHTHLLNIQDSTFDPMLVSEVIEYPEDEDVFGLPKLLLEYDPVALLGVFSGQLPSSVGAHITDVNSILWAYKANFYQIHPYRPLRKDILEICRVVSEHTVEYRGVTVLPDLCLLFNPHIKNMRATTSLLSVSELYRILKHRKAYPRFLTNEYLNYIIRKVDPTNTTKIEVLKNILSYILETYKRYITPRDSTVRSILNQIEYDSNKLSRSKQYKELP